MICMFTKLVHILVGWRQRRWRRLTHSHFTIPRFCVRVHIDTFNMHIICMIKNVINFCIFVLFCFFLYFLYYIVAFCLISVSLFFLIYFFSVYTSRLPQKKHTHTHTHTHFFPQQKQQATATKMSKILQQHRQKKERNPAKKQWKICSRSSSVPFFLLCCCFEQ